MVVDTGCVTTKELARIAETAGSSKAITTTVTTAIHSMDTTGEPSNHLCHEPFFYRCYY